MNEKKIASERCKKEEKKVFDNILMLRTYSEIFCADKNINFSDF